MQIEEREKIIWNSWNEASTSLSCELEVLNSKRPLVVACIPAYNEEKTIARVVLQAQRYVDRVVVCDDGSRDLTAEIAEGLGADVMRHERQHDVKEIPLWEGKSPGSLEVRA